MKTAFIILMTIMSLLSVINLEAAVNGDHTPIIVEWYGHACFLFTLENRSKILIDPYDNTRIPYDLPVDPVDVVFSTHDHFDHSAVGAVPSRIVLRAEGWEPVFFGSKSGFTTNADGSLKIDLKGDPLECATIPSFHDDKKGSQRGANGIIRFKVDGLTFVHLGDLGDTLNSDQIAKLQPVDVLMIPVGGYYTIDATQAKMVIDQLKPRVVIPMHYKTEALPKEFPIATVDGFLEGLQNVHRNAGSTITLRADKLPEKQTVEVLKYHGQK